jgi:hypothetical protein
LNKQSPIYSFKFTITWIFIYLGIVYLLLKLLNLFIAMYIGLWILNLVIEICERILNRFNKTINTVER